MGHQNEHGTRGTAIWIGNGDHFGLPGSILISSDISHDVRWCKMQADRSSIISPSKATADLQASRPSWKAGRQLGHALDQQVSSLTWYQVDRLTDKCWLALGRQANQKHTLSPHFTTFHHYHHCHHWYHFHYLYHWYQSFQPRSFPLGMVCERLMEDLASTRLRVQHRSSGWSLDDPWMISGIFRIFIALVKDLQSYRNYICLKSGG